MLTSCDVYVRMCAVAHVDRNHSWMLLIVYWPVWDGTPRRHRDSIPNDSTRIQFLFHSISQSHCCIQPASSSCWITVAFFCGRQCFILGHFYLASFYASAVHVVTNLIHDFMAVTFAVKLAVFGAKRAFPWNLLFFLWTSTHLVSFSECFQTFINTFLCRLSFTVCHTSACVVTDEFY